METARNLDDLRWHRHGERTLYDNQWIRLVQVDVQAPDGRRWWHHVVRLQRVAGAVVVNGNHEVLMMYRHRFAPGSNGEWGWELPGGIIAESEDGSIAAAREVEEETGWRPSAMTHLVSYQPMPGMVDTPHEVYLARGAERVGEPTDAEEAARVDWLPLSRMIELATAGQLMGSGTLIGLLWAIATERLDPPQLPD